MPRDIVSIYRTRLAREKGAVKKDWGGRLSVALTYPNYYRLGMSNLGFQVVYDILNQRSDVVAERVFLPEGQEMSLYLQSGKSLMSLESQTPLQKFDLVAFSLSFENDYPHILSILDNIGLPLRAEHRGDEDPLLLAGGVASFINPESIAPFFDCFLIGEAEVILPRFIKIFNPGNSKHATLISIARNVQGAYVPAFYRVDYQPDGTIASFSPLEDVPPSVTRTYLKDLTRTATCSAILTSDTTFDRTYMIEVGRGCPHGCRFCSAGFIYRPPRFRPISELIKNINQGICQTRRIGLVGSAVSDLPGIGDLCVQYMNEDVRLSFSSLRADKISTELLSALAQSKVKTATIAPDAGSERMRKVINKGITEEAILAAAEALVANGIPNLKLYFMIGLPTETEEDQEKSLDLVRWICNKGGTVRAHYLTPLPGTPYASVTPTEISDKVRRELGKLALHGKLTGYWEKH